LSNFAEIEVLEDGVGELVEFFLVNFTWVLGVNLLSGGFNPFPLISGDGVVEGFSEFLKSDFDLIVGKGSTVVGIESLESFSGESFGDTSFTSFFDSDGRGGGEEGGDGEFHFFWFVFLFILNLINFFGLNMIQCGRYQDQFTDGILIEAIFRLSSKFLSRSNILQFLNWSN
jgi:hypothetical protein